MVHSGHRHAYCNGSLKVSYQGTLFNKDVLIEEAGVGKESQQW